MNPQISSNPQYKQVTVDVPEDRVAEFHAFFARFLAGGPRGRGRRGRLHHGRHSRGDYGRGCARRETTEQAQPSTEAARPSTETTQL
jgi:hypothetical protein